jgi:hypothetical protein
MNVSIKEIFQNAKCDPDLISAINIDDLLLAIENDKNEHLDNKTLANIAEDKYKQLKNLNLGKERTKELFDKLSEYRFIDEIHQLHKGKHIRWIRPAIPADKRPAIPADKRPAIPADKRPAIPADKRNDKKINKPPAIPASNLTVGGIGVDIKFLDTGTHILVLTKNPKCRCIQYNFDDCITFQKLSTDEQLILAAYEYIQEK